MLRQLPHLLTLLRLAAAPLLAWLIISRRFREAVAVALLAGGTDWLDGFAARRLGVSGKLGMVFDPLADKVMLVTLFVALTYAGLIRAWLLGLVLGRDLVIVIGVLLLRIYRGIRRFTPSLLGKVSTFFQIAFVLVVVLHAAMPARWLLALARLGFALTTFFTILSGADYVRIGIEMARRQRG